MPAGYYKIVIAGNYQGQAINNIVYYGVAGSGNPAPNFDADIALDLLDAFGEGVVDSWLAAMPSAYNLGSLQASFVDARNVVDPTSYQVDLPVNQAGSRANSTVGQYQCAILAYGTAVAPGADLPMKRSYLAFGPLLNTDVAIDGNITASGSIALAPILNDLMTPLVGALSGPWGQVRIGRTESPDPIRVGRVIWMTRRQFASTRASRKRRPTG